ncbi:LysR family transcriptional regulator [Actinomadura sp. HBU206391]|uniref:LysR family transcriptional regulator n=1 Tax=Actinomadura sp. HBU206391 TaxID=2731692 RepID=UPI00164EDD83|nr:LysR family transcriptional regulator [Actinomadura sp. HBU206391]MBC6457349.1 LysR family transcriptional regulator [Actinomadura sp. HBU206391]
MLDTWSLRVLVEVGERGSFSAAADAMSLTQPAVSRQIAGLERRLGVRLFQRVPRGVRATAAGEVALDSAREVLARLRAMESRLTAFAHLETGRLRLSAFSSANTFFVPEAVRRFGDAHPGVTLSLLQADPAGPVAAVRDGRVDVALATAWDLPGARGDAGDEPAPDDPRPAEDVESIPLLDEELQVAVAADHRLARHDRVRLRDLREETWIEGAHPDCLGPVADLADALGGPPRIGFTCDDWNGKQALVAAGAGVMLVPTLAGPAMRRDVMLRAVTPALPSRRLYVVAAPPPFRAPAVAAMLTILVALAARHRS